VLKSTSDKEVRQVGSQLVTVDPDTGEVEVIYAAPETGGGKGEEGTGFFMSGGLKIDKADIGEGSQILAGRRGDDGFTNHAKYVEMYKHWIDNGGLPQDFFKQYDPDYYLNPADQSIPSYIRSQMSKSNDDDFDAF